MNATAILPVKRFAAAKRRLGGGISDERRRALIEAMLHDVLTAISGARMIDRTLVVTGEPAAAAIAAEHGAEAIADPPEAGHSEAAILGAEAAASAGATCIAMVPGDCPLLDPRELDSVLTGMPEPYATIVPDRHRTGTNALILAPPDAIRPGFGEGSCERHADRARQAGIPFSVERLDSLALDLDTPADIVALTTAIEGGRGRAPRTAKALGI
jgi:2-phospho-L-lactate guanylyltransferase